MTEALAPEERVAGAASDARTYVPGTAGAPWTAEETLIVRAKIRRIFNEGWHVAKELGLHKPSGVDGVHPNGVPVADAWNSAPDAAKVLRLGFHDCIPYKDGTRGCDGCLEWNLGKRYKVQEEGEQFSINATNRADGHNNGLGITVMVLEEIYKDKDFPQRTPSLTTSLFESGKSRADLWAFATMEAVLYGVELNNVACEDDTNLLNRPYSMTKKCHPLFGKPECKATMPRAFVFKTGRKDCVSGDSSLLGYQTLKPESHPDPAWNGPKTVDYFASHFNFTGRQTVAIMGAHNLGKLHFAISLNRYTWKAFSGDLFNNGYYRNMAKMPDPYYAAQQADRPCNVQGVLNSSGATPESRWVTQVRGDTSVGGPVQWINEKNVCPCFDHRFWNNREKGDQEFCCGSTTYTEGNDADGSGMQYKTTCTSGIDTTVGTTCDRWRLISGFDETMLSSDIGLYLDFNVTDEGVPTDCPGLADFTPENWIIGQLGRGVQAPYGHSTIDGVKADAGCGLNQQDSEGVGSLKMHEVVELYAHDQAAFLGDFMAALEHMLQNVEDPVSLTTSADAVMSGFTCPAQDARKQRWKNAYTCSRTS
jgi:hypothetical protein